MRNPRFLDSTVADLNVDEFDALPAGAVVIDCSGNGTRHTKQENGAWVRGELSGSDYGSELRTIVAAASGGVRVASLPPVTEAGLEAAGVGSIVQTASGTPGISYVKIPGQRWQPWVNGMRTGASSYPNGAFDGSNAVSVSLVQSIPESSAVGRTKERLRNAIDSRRSGGNEIAAAAAWVRLGIEPLPKPGDPITKAVAMIGLPPGSIVQGGDGEGWWVAKVGDYATDLFGPLELLASDDCGEELFHDLLDGDAVTVVAVAGAWPNFERPRDVLEAAWALAEPLREHFDWCSWVTDTLADNRLRPEDAPEPEPATPEPATPEPATTGSVMLPGSAEFTSLPDGSTFRTAIAGTSVIKSRGRALYANSLHYVRPMTELTLVYAAPAPVEQPF